MQNMLVVAWTFLSQWGAYKAFKEVLVSCGIMGGLRHLVGVGPQPLCESREMIQQEPQEPKQKRECKDRKRERRMNHIMAGE